MQKTEWMPKEPICHRIQLFYNPSTSVAYKNVIKSATSCGFSLYYRFIIYRHSPKILIFY